MANNGLNTNTIIQQIQPDLLDDPEVAYELKLRRTDPSQFTTRESAVEALRKLVDREEKGELGAPFNNVDRDDKELEVIYREVAGITESGENSISTSFKEALIERLRHYIRRLTRIRSTIPEVIESINEYTTQVSSLIREWTNDVDGTTQNIENANRTQQQQQQPNNSHTNHSNPAAEATAPTTSQQKDSRGASSKVPRSDENQLLFQQFLKFLGSARGDTKPPNSRSRPPNSETTQPSENPRNQRPISAIPAQQRPLLNAPHHPLPMNPSINVANQQSQQSHHPNLQRPPLQNSSFPQPSANTQRRPHANSMEDSLSLYTEFMRFMGENRNGQREQPRLPQRVEEPEWHPNYRKKNPVKKWNLKYSGDSSPLGLKQFLNRVEFLANREEMELQAVLKDIHFLLAGQAETWYFQRGNRIENWQQFCYEIKARFLDPNHEQITTRQLFNCKQYDSEEFSKFLERFEKIEMDLEHALEDQEKLQILKANLNYTYTDKLIAKEFTSLNSFMAICRNLQLHLKAKSGRRLSSTQQDTQQHGNNHPTNTSWNFQSGRNQNTSANSNQNPRSTPSSNSGRVSQNPFKCFNCNEMGHRYSSCTTPLKQFCRRCGHPNVHTNECTNCRKNQ